MGGHCLLHWLVACSLELVLKSNQTIKGALYWAPHTHTHHERSTTSWIALTKSKEVPRRVFRL